jgi:predicted DCC family thiol-disulfide oxidoreductase YuxK
MSMRLCGPVLVYDGDCRFCTNSAQWIETRWPHNSASIVASQKLTNSDLGIVGLSRDDVRRAVWWITPEESAAGHLAVARAIANCGGTIGMLGSLLSAPPLRWLAKPTYEVIARHRHRMPGATSTCRLKPLSPEFKKTTS